MALMASICCRRRRKRIEEKGRVIEGRRERGEKEGRGKMSGKRLKREEGEQQKEELEGYGKFIQE